MIKDMKREKTIELERLNSEVIEIHESILQKINTVKTLMSKENIISYTRYTTKGPKDVESLLNEIETSSKNILKGVISKNTITSLYKALTKLKSLYHDIDDIYMVHEWLNS